MTWNLILRCDSSSGLPFYVCCSFWSGNGGLRGTLPFEIWALSKLETLIIRKWTRTNSTHVLANEHGYLSCIFLVWQWTVDGNNSIQWYPLNLVILQDLRTLNMRMRTQWTICAVASLMFIAFGSNAAFRSKVLCFLEKMLAMDLQKVSQQRLEY